MKKSFFDIVTYEDDMQAMLDKHNIKNLIESERYYRDNLHFDKMERTYSEESRVRITWYDGDGREFVRRSSGQELGSKHKIHSTMIWLWKNKALAEMQCTLVGPREKVDGVEFDVKGYSRLLYKVQKENGVWKIKGFDCIYERDWMDPVEGKSIPETAVSNKEKRESYKCLTDHLGRKGLDVTPELPGEDDLKTINALYDEASEWIFSEE